MGSFVEPGLSAGQVLPAPLTAAVTNGMHLNAAGLWVYPPGYLLASDMVGAAAPSIASEASLLAAAFTNMFPVGVVHDMVKIRASGTYTAGGTQTFTLNLYYGTTIIATATTGSLASGAARSWFIEVEIAFSVINSSTGAVKVDGIIMPATTVGGGFNGPAALADLTFNDGVAIGSLNTTIAQTCDLKAKVSTSTATAQLNKFQARYYQKGY